MTRRCGNCHWWLHMPERGRMGECRGAPPSSGGNFPIIPAWLWCGSFRLREGWEGEQLPKAVIVPGVVSKRDAEGWRQMATVARSPTASVLRSMFDEPPLGKTFKIEGGEAPGTYHCHSCEEDGDYWLLGLTRLAEEVATKSEAETA